MKKTKKEELSHLCIFITNEPMEVGTCITIQKVGDIRLWDILKKEMLKEVLENLEQE